MNKKSPTLTMDMVCILHLCATPFVLGGRKNAKRYTYGSSIKSLFSPIFLLAKWEILCFK